MKVKFQLGFVAGFLLAAGSLAVAGFLVRSNSARFEGDRTVANSS